MNTSIRMIIFTAVTGAVILTNAACSQSSENSIIATLPESSAQAALEPAEQTPVRNTGGSNASFSF